MAATALPGEPRRILIIKPSALGDIVHTLPILNLLRMRWPTAHIAWLVTPAFAGLLEGHPQLDEVIRFERRRFGTGWWNPRAAMALLRFVCDLRQKHFDLVVDLQGLFRSGWLAFATGSGTRIGFADARELAWIFYTQGVEIPAVEQHALDRSQKVARALGCADQPIVFSFPPTQPLAVPILEPYAVLLPGTNWETKRWPAKSFAQLVAPLRERFGLRAVIAGASDATALAKEIRQQAGDRDLIDLTGQTSLPQLVGLLAGAALVVANDSGPMHIAAALGRPMVTMFGPTNAIRTGPYRRLDTVIRLDIVCSPCYSRKCSHQSCLQWLESERVMEAIAVQLGLDKSTV